MTAAPVRLLALGDAAVLVVLGEAIDERVNARVHRLAAELRRLHAADPRFGAPVPAYASVLVPLDPIDPGLEAAIDVLSDVVAGTASGAPTVRDEAGALHELPTRYGGVDGPDLAAVARLHDLRPAEVVELHASVAYRAWFVGFAPGFAYLGPVPDQIATPRLASPRARVPAGSVGLADEQTAVYPVASPGGWRLLGRTDVAIWRPAVDRPALIEPGDRVRFVPQRH